ncbi:MAG: TonB-dependent receptor [Prevotella sp.]|nr:TonB-dependent receptor [Prevotella sp.]
MYKPAFLRRQVLVFHHFGNKGYSLFSCLGREVVCSVLSVATLTYATAGSVSTQPVVTDSTATTTAREMLLEEVSVTGSRAPLTTSQAARMVTVLDRADIQQAAVQSMNDLLKMAVGVDVRQRGPLGTQTDISIRGGTQDQIIILLNGINICDPQTGHNVMDLPVDLSEVVRVEVLEGPAGRVYGTSSLVGAINIVTRPDAVRPRRANGTTSLSAFVEGGSFGYAKAGVRAALLPSAAHPSRFSHSVSASYGRSDGYSRSKEGTLNSDYSGTKAFYQGRYEDNHAVLSWHVGIADKGWGSSTSYASPKWQADDQYEHTTKIFSAIRGETKGGKFHFTPTLYWNEHYDRYEGYRGLPEKMAYNYNRTDFYGVNLSSYFDWAGGRTAFGAELRNEDLVSGNLGEPLSRPHSIAGTDRDYTLGINRTNISAYLEHNLLLRHWTVSAGLVAARNTWSDMNMTIYPGVDISYRPDSRWRLHASYNTSLRMPSFTEMYYRLQGYRADPHLKPEEMQAVELGVTFSRRTFTVSAAVWHHHGTNMIDWIMDTSLGDEAVWESVNHTTINSTGFEVSAQCHFHRVSGQVSYAYVHQDKEQEAHIVSQYALEYLRHKLVAKGVVSLTRQLHWSLSVRWQDRVGSYTDFDGSVCSYQPYAVTDTRLSWKGDGWKIYGEVNNLFDKRYRDYGLVPQPGRWMTAGAAIDL